MSKNKWQLWVAIVVAVNMLIDSLILVFGSQAWGIYCLLGIVCFAIGETVGACFMALYDYFSDKDKDMEDK